MRIILDTNVLVAALAADGLCRDLVRRRVRAHELCTSEALLKELAGILRRKFCVTAADVPWLLEYRRRARLVSPPQPPPSICRDPDDDIVLATAVAAQAGVIITGDADLLDLKSHQGIAILSPRQFLERIDGLK